MKGTNWTTFGTKGAGEAEEEPMELAEVASTERCCSSQPL
jgi:hypothetical protein